MAGLCRDGDDQAVEILDAGELWDQGVDIIGLDVEGDGERASRPSASIIGLRNSGARTWAIGSAMMA